MLGTDRNLLRAVKRTTQFDRGGERLFATIGCATHDADEARPVHLRRALQLPRPSLAGHPWIVDGRLEVQDDGPGFPAEETSRLFELFYRSPGTASGGTAEDTGAPYARRAGGDLDRDPSGC